MKKKINILYISHGATIYGAETSLYLLVKYLNKDIFHPIVVLPSEGPLRDKFKAIGVSTHIAPLWSWLGISSADTLHRCLADLPERVQRIVDIVRQNDIRIIHTNVSQILEGALAAKLASKPHICTVRGNYFALTCLRDHTLLASGYELLSSLSQMVIPVSNSVKDAISPFVNQTKLRVIYNGIETHSFQVQNLYGLSNSPLHQTINSGEAKICSIGRVVEEKGFDILIDAAAIVVNAYPGSRFSVFGLIHDKFLYQRLLQQVSRLNLTDVIRFEGHTDQVQEKLQESDLFVLSSEMEGFPRVLLEAMLAGKPIVSTRCEGAEDAIIDGKIGYLVPLNDPRALAEAILKVLDNPEHARKMGLLGKERVLKHFDARKTAEQYEALYHEVLNGEMIKQKQDRNDENVLMRVLMEFCEKYGDELFQMGSRLRDLERFENKVKNTWAYRCFRVTKDFVRKSF